MSSKKYTLIQQMWIFLASGVIANVIAAIIIIAMILVICMMLQYSMDAHIIRTIYAVIAMTVWTFIFLI